MLGWWLIVAFPCRSELRNAWIGLSDRRLPMPIRTTECLGGAWFEKCFSFLIQAAHLFFFFFFFPPDFTTLIALHLTAQPYSGPRIPLASLALAACVADWSVRWPYWEADCPNVTDARD